MKRFFAVLALSLTMVVLGIAGTTMAIGGFADEGTSDNKVIAAVTGDANTGFVTEDEWAEIVAHELTGTNTCSGTVKLATVGTNLFFRMTVSDATMFKGKDRIAFQITVGEKVQQGQGHYEGTWINEDKYDFGKNVQYDNVADETTHTYTVTIGFNLGDSYAQGAEVSVSFTHNDVLTADANWGAGEAITFSDTLTFASESTSGGDDGGSQNPSETPNPEPENPAPENPNLNVVITDLASQPTETDWANATAYNLVANNSTITDGATGTLKVYTAAQNIFFRLEVTDPTTHTNADGLYVYLGTEDCHIETRGNYESWLSPFQNDLGSPSLLAMSTTATDGKSYTAGVYTFDYGFYIPNIYGEGSTIRLCVKHRDSRSASEAWADGDYTHTIYFDQTLTFGAPADTTIRPQDATEGFTGSSENISYNKADIKWTEYTGADTYKLFVYTVNAEGSAEAYTYVITEGPVYAGYANYAETISGLSATTDYAVQIVACNSKGEAIAYSSLVTFKTISRQEALDNPTNPSNPSDTTNDEKNGGCGSTIGIGEGTVIVLLGAVAVLLKKRKTCR